MKQYILINILITTLFITYPSIAMKEPKVIKPRYCLFPSNDWVAIAGDYGINFYDVCSKKLFQRKHPHKKIKDVALSNDVLAYVTEDLKENHSLYIYARTEQEFPVKLITTSSHPLYIAANNHIVSSYHKEIINSQFKNIINVYDYRDKSIERVIEDPYDETAPFPYVSCHPTKSEFIYPYSGKNLVIVQLFHDYDDMVKMELRTDLVKCNGAEYNPTGTILAIKGNNWQYFIYNLESRNVYAYQIGLENRIYISSAFHPHDYMFFLLSENNIIECWDYKRRILIFSTGPLLTDKKTNKINTGIGHSKRLAVAPDGRRLVTALENTWGIIPIPHKNLFLIYLLLCKNNIPKYPRNSIIRIIAPFLKNMEFSQFNFLELAKVEALPPTQGGIDLSKEAMKPTEYRHLTAIYQSKQQ